MAPLTDLFKAEGWTKAMPRGLLDILSYRGDIWSVPVNIHRANVLWYNKKLFTDNSLTPPETWDQFKTVADKLKAKGVIPLALGDKEPFASGQLFETILIGTLGADKYKGLWTGTTDWKGADVTQALNTFKTALSYV